MNIVDQINLISEKQIIYCKEYSCFSNIDAFTLHSVLKEQKEKFDFRDLVRVKGKSLVETTFSRDDIY